MNFDQFIQITEQCLVIAALAGAIWSAREFIIRQKAKSESLRIENLSKWRKVAVHQLIANSDEFLTTEQVTNELRQKSFETEFEIKRDELNEDTVRQLLMELISSRVLGQRFPDRYGIFQLPHDISVPAVEDNIRGNLAFRDAFALVMQYPGHYNDSKLFSELGPRTQLRQSDFLLAISDMEARNLAERRENGYWHPKQSIESSP